MMLTGFLVCAALLLAVFLAFLLWPRREKAGVSSTAVNATIIRDQLQEVEGDLRLALLDTEDAAVARTELQRRLLEDSETEQTPPPTTPDKRWRIFLGVGLTCLAVLLYGTLGNIQALLPQARPQFTQADIESMVARLAARLEQGPDNPEGWIMLARSYRMLGRLPEAEKAFMRAGNAINGQPDLLAAYADTAASTAHSFKGKPDQLIAQALAIDPRHPMALWLAGSSAFAAGDYDKASTLWQNLLPLVPQGSEQATSLQEAIAQAQAKRSRKN